MPINKPTPPRPTHLKLTDGCPVCHKSLKAKREVLIGIDSTILACMGCQIYGIEGDSKFFSREELGDFELEKILRERAVSIMNASYVNRSRYEDWRSLSR